MKKNCNICKIEKEKIESFRKRPKRRKDMLEFLSYLKENYKEDVSSTEKIISEKWNKVIEVIKAAFDEPYIDKKNAIFKIQNEFVNPKISPKNIDSIFVKENLNYIIEKINSLEEGDVKIIINTGDVQKGSTRTSVTGMETESKKGKKDVVKEEMDEVEPTEELGTEMGGSVGGEGEDEKVVKVSVVDNKVTVEPSENTGLEKSEHDFEDEEEAKAFVDSLENLFKGFKVEKGESEEEPAEGESEGAGASEEEISGTEEESTSSNKKLVSEADEFGDESEDVSEEPEDAGEEPEDAGEEPEDAGEEPEDAGEIDWEDIAAGEGEEEGDAEECIVAPVRVIGSTELESLDLQKLINTLVKVESKWYKVNSITENNEVICIDKEGTENYFDLEQIEEMEQTLGELAKSAVSPNAEEETEKLEDSEKAEEKSCPAGAEECVPCDKGEEELGSVGLQKALSPEQFEELKAWIADPQNDPSDELYQALMDYYADEMPYGTMKARTGDPFEWLLQKTSAELGGEEEAAPAEEEAEKPKESEDDEKEGEESEDDDEEASGSQEESLSFVKIAANKYFDLDEDALTPPKMATTQGGGLTSKPGVINQTIASIKPAPKAPVVKGPTAALTAKPSKPGEKIEKIPSAPSSPAKKGPSTALTAKPKAPPKKIEKVGSAPKAPSKAAPKGSFTAKPGKTGQKVEKISAPALPPEYKKGGFKG